MRSCNLTEFALPCYMIENEEETVHHILILIAHNNKHLPFALSKQMGSPRLCWNHMNLLVTISHDAGVSEWVTAWQQLPSGLHLTCVSWGDKLDTRLSALDKRGVKYKSITPAKYTTHSVTEFEHFVPLHKSIES